MLPSFEEIPDDSSMVSMEEFKDHRRRIENAKTSRSTCSKCKEYIKKGSVRFGTEVEIYGRLGYYWRHLECVTERQKLNMKLIGIEQPQDLFGFEDLDTDEVVKPMQYFYHPFHLFTMVVDDLFQTTNKNYFA